MRPKTPAAILFSIESLLSDVCNPCSIQAIDCFVSNILLFVLVIVYFLVLSRNLVNRVPGLNKHKGVAETDTACERLPRFYDEVNPAQPNTSLDLK